MTGGAPRGDRRVSVQAEAAARIARHSVTRLSGWDRRRPATAAHHCRLVPPNGVGERGGLVSALPGGRPRVHVHVVGDVIPERCQVALEGCVPEARQRGGVHMRMRWGSSPAQSLKCNIVWPVISEPHGAQDVSAETAETLKKKPGRRSRSFRLHPNQISPDQHLRYRFARDRSPTCAVRERQGACATRPPRAAFAWCAPCAGGRGARPLSSVVRDGLRPVARRPRLPACLPISATPRLQLQLNCNC